jgi:integrase
VPELRFTEEDVKAAKVGKTHVLGTPNLYLFKSAKGVCRYLYRYTVPGQRRVTETSVGKPGITLNKAREIAAKYAELLCDGIDPQEAKRWKPRDEKTFGQLADEWIEANKHRWGEKRIREANLLLHQHGKRLTNLRLVQLRPEVIRDELRPLLRTKPHQAHRALGMWKQIIKYAAALGMYPRNHNPADWKQVQKFLLPGYSAPPRGHFPAMPCEQVPQFLRELRQRDGMGAVALQLMIYTMLRTKELLGARWPEFDFPNRTWVVPAERMKIRQEFHVPLSDPAIALLQRLQERATTQFVLTGYKRYQPLAEKSMLLLMRGMGIPKEISTVHGLRSTFRGWAARKPFDQIDQIAAEICLSHTPANPDMQKWLPFNPAVVEAYQRDDLLDKRRMIMDAWAAYIAP